MSPSLEELSGCRVFLTGHTGFKGTWLAFWLDRLGCKISGFSLPPPETSLFNQTRIVDRLQSHTIGDIRNRSALSAALQRARPHLVIHMAAQSLVRPSYADPATTWDTNVMGSVNLLEAARSCPDIRAVLVITSDKCYENREWDWGYRERDRLGGRDPYSASKACTELVTKSYRDSFFQSDGPLIATARAGNVIGGGDWSDDRLIPDAVRAIAAGKKLVVRNPNASRPWQHVLDCLSGYLTLAARLLNGERGFASSFNFGPAPTDNLKVADVLDRLASHWPELQWERDPRSNPHEATNLYLDSSLARETLHWRPGWTLDGAIKATADWYREFGKDPESVATITSIQLDQYLSSKCAGSAGG